MNPRERLDSSEEIECLGELQTIICGCANQERTWGKVLEELERLNRGDYKPDDDLVCAIVDYAGLSEHGTSIRGGWLTEKGVMALDFLRAALRGEEKQPSEVCCGPDYFLDGDDPRVICDGDACTLATAVSEAVAREMVALMNKNTEKQA